MTSQHDWNSSAPQPGPSGGSYGTAPQDPGVPGTGGARGSGKDGDVHTYLYYPAFAFAVVLGGILALVLYVWIGNSTTGTTRIPVILLAAPALILVAAVRLGDSHVARRYPNLVPASKRAAVSPVQSPSQPWQAPAQVGGPQGGAAQHPYGSPGAYAPQAGYGHSSQPGAGAPAPMTPGHGQVGHQGQSRMPSQAPYGSMPSPPAGQQM
ncbi:hypothetical protein [Actinomyces capricornis]|uniref:Uncharacterized protein n=1 Tax=Actinomyces capricornis TaxID=2755559 RepID=A0ABM7UBX2_9ACTO|nr:hypothetical protein [Actinomyces capricornis]BDA64767.1 hypothetical protein MANAM107_16010 [Actinomyces capricornis]